MDSGVYVLWLYLANKTTITIGKLGTFSFKQVSMPMLGGAAKFET